MFKKYKVKTSVLNGTQYRILYLLKTYASYFQKQISELILNVVRFRVLIGKR